MPKGYSGKVLRVNLTTSACTVDHPDELFYRRYLGGWGFYELKDASRLWGKDTAETQETVKDELGDSRTRLAVIGPAGESQTLFSCIINDDNRAVGRTGLRWRKRYSWISQPVMPVWCAASEG